MVAGGGTGGHVYPALAVVEGLRKRDPRALFLWIGSPNKLESQVVPLANIDFRAIKLRGLSRRFNIAGIFGNIAALFEASRALKESKRIISEFKPQVVIGTGGYVSGPPVAQAVKMGVPSVLIEPNSYPGLTVRWLAKRVDRIFLGYEEAVQYLPGANYMVTGTPVREEFLNAKRDDGIHAMGLLVGKPCLLVVGGSQGAENINRAVLEFVEIAANEEPGLLHDIQILHQTGGKGPSQLEEIRSKYPQADYMKTSYIDRMPLALAAADFIVSRAGAATLSEIKARGMASVLIPYPYAAEDHQYKNAKAMSDAGAAVLIEDKELNGRTLFNVVTPLLKDPVRRNDMAAKAKGMFRPDCLDVICSEIFRLAGDTPA